MRKAEHVIAVPVRQEDMHHAPVAVMLHQCAKRTDACAGVEDQEGAARRADLDTARVASIPHRAWPGAGARATRTPDSNPETGYSRHACAYSLGRERASREARLTIVTWRRWTEISPFS